MRLFHRMTDADEMLRDSPRYLVDRAASGVWLSHRTLDVGDGADAREYSGVWLSADAEVCRGCFVPAEVLNRYPVRVRQTRSGRCAPTRAWIQQR